MRIRTVLRSTAAALLLLTGANAGAEAAPLPRAAGYDAALASVRTPGFAGVWIDSSGRLVVSMTRPSAAAARGARADVASALGRADLASKPLVVQRARYSFRQLTRWYGAMKADAFALPGSVSGDVDERGNVLRFGVSDVAAATPALARIAASYGVPAGAIAVEHATPATPTSLSDRIRPLVGGLSIYAASNGCTLGVMAVLNGAKGFVTNSHCTIVQGAVNGHAFFQGPVGANPPVAFETVDPPLTSCGAVCRYSDTAFAQVVNDADYLQGYIARPTGGPTTWNNTDTYRIVDESEPVVGDAVSKVGATSGLTSGTVTATCVDTQQRILNQGFNVIDMHCQTYASYQSISGDSGSPVFRIVSGNDVALVGINWGSSGAGGVFSTVGNMQRSDELGDLSFCATGFAC